MGFPQNCNCSNQNRNLTVSFIFLLLWSFNAMTFPAQGRPVVEMVEGAMAVEKRAAVIGSRPPRCERRCSYCSHCEAIQVPVTTHRKTRAVVFSREDDISNYKPISWKCKCGNLIFNP